MAADAEAEGDGTYIVPFVSDRSATALGLASGTVRGHPVAGIPAAAGICMLDKCVLREVCLTLVAEVNSLADHALQPVALRCEGLFFLARFGTAFQNKIQRVENSAPARCFRQGFQL